MRNIHCGLVLVIPVLVVLASCTGVDSQKNDLISNTYPEAQAELREVVNSIASDAMTANIEGLQDIHLESDKFTKFGPRSFDRQDVESTNASEAAFFGSITNLNYDIRDLKIDVFGDVGIVTYYPYVSFVKDGAEREVNGRQTLVFLKTESGWKIIHEHGTIRNSP